MAVGRQRDIQRRHKLRAELGSLADKIQQALTQQRLAASEPDLLNAQGDEDTQDAGVVRDRQLGVLGAVFAGAAVDAAIVAADRKSVV